MKKKAAGSRTLLMSVIMSAPGPLVVGLGLLVGKSSTQLADFIRRSAELLAIIASYVIYRMTNEGESTDIEKKIRLEKLSNRFVGLMMCLSGVILLFLSIFYQSEEKGNVVPGLVIATLGVIANLIFWLRYTKLSKQTGNVILLVQGRLYRAKFLVDLCVTISLSAVLLFPNTVISICLDMIGSIVVAIYLFWSGTKTIKESSKEVSLANEQ